MTQTILLVDDDALLLEALRRSFHATPLTVLTADSADAAMEILQQQAIDVVVSDDAMPGISGLELLAQIRHLFPSTMRIMLTGKATIERMTAAVNEGNVFRFLLKPCPHQVLAEAVRHALDHKLLIDRGNESVVAMRRQGLLLRRLIERHPEVLADAVQAIAGIQLKPEDFQTATVLAEQMEVQIRSLSGLHPALTKKER